MYKLVIADDEKKILTLLSSIVNWKSIGFEIVGTFTDGREVIEYIKHNHVDCIISDICMKSASGIELAEYIYYNEPKIRLVLISGYQDFNYASAAIRFGVDNYLLKPVKIQDIKNTFQIIYNKLESDKINTEIAVCFQQEIFKKVINGFYNDISTLNSALAQLHCDISADMPCSTVSIQLSRPILLDETLITNIFLNISNIVHKSIRSFFLGCKNNIAEYILISSDKQETGFIKYAHIICDNIKEFLKIDAKILSYSIQEELKHFLNISNTNRELLKDCETRLLSALYSGNTEDISPLIDKAISLAQKLQGAIPFDYITKLIIKFSDKVPDIIDDNIKIRYLDAVKCSKTLNDLTELSNNFFIYISDKSKNIDMQKKNILKIRDYLVNHYSESVSLIQLADMAHLTPTWFSKVFKDIVGQTYSDFLLSCRINASKDLLINTHLKVHEISKRVGYANITSFVRFFKANCGMSPTEYRNKFAKDDY